MRHCILVKYNQEVKDRAAFAQEALQVFAPLKDMPGIHAVTATECLPLADNRYDLLIEIYMERDALPSYNESAPHKLWKRDYAKYIDKKAIFDIA